MTVIYLAFLASLLVPWHSPWYPVSIRLQIPLTAFADWQNIVTEAALNLSAGTNRLNEVLAAKFSRTEIEYHSMVK